MRIMLVAFLLSFLSFLMTGVALGQKINSIAGELSTNRPGINFEIPGKEGMLLQLDPVLLSDDNLYFDITVQSPTGEQECFIPKWKGSSGALGNGLRHTFKETGLYRVNVARRDNTSGPFKISVRIIFNNNIVDCAEKK